MCLRASVAGKSVQPDPPEQSKPSRESGTIAVARNNGGGKAIIDITVTSVTRERGL